MSDIWSVNDHLEDILAAVRPLEPIELQLLDAHGCVLAEDVTVPIALPPFDNSSMDGYAVRSADLRGCDHSAPARLVVTGEVVAGTGDPPVVGPGQSVRIMTGGPVPQGADAIVPVEWTDGGSGHGPAETMAPGSVAYGQVQVFRAPEPGQYIRPRGSDIAAGSVALTAGTLIGAPQVGLLAGIGRAFVRVRPRPRVVVVSTGSELVRPGDELGPGRIYDSNSFTLSAAAKEAGAVVYRVSAVADDARALRTVLEDQLIRADLIVTSGGVSVGAHDVVKEALSNLGRTPGHVDFRRVAMQPGKPQGFGVLGEARIPLLALPGNPVSSYVSFEVFVRPALRRMSGLPNPFRPGVRATLEGDGPRSSPPGKRQFLRGVHDSYRRTVRPVGGSGSHLTGALAHADALIVVPEHTTEITPGDELDVVLLDTPV
ncbi:molybdotransferase-like divisome protein Glp [Streptomyces lonarensis]|uniref:molybdotransferase-like divisome protein Glp n=1 Tax=Streptomyces lonarensis TaxID=700599 RepID=UPI001ADDD10C|nr:gephyrin-like molybdotransferase Glp [Streptomyces lonarensis]